MQLRALMCAVKAAECCGVCVVLFLICPLLCLQTVMLAASPVTSPNQS
jgi:hypothetical protein